MSTHVTSVTVPVVTERINNLPAEPFMKKDVREDEQPIETRHEDELGEREATIKPDVLHVTDVNQLAEVAHGEASEVVPKHAVHHRRRGEMHKEDIIAQGVRNARRAGNLDGDALEVDIVVPERLGSRANELPTQVLGGGAGAKGQAQPVSGVQQPQRGGAGAKEERGGSDAAAAGGSGEGGLMSGARETLAQVTEVTRARAAELARSVKETAMHASEVAVRAAHLSGEEGEGGADAGGDAKKAPAARDGGEEDVGAVHSAVDAVAGGAGRMFASVRQSVAGLSQAAKSG